jgi:predicted HAD superfamily hydrolase
MRVSIHNHNSGIVFLDTMQFRSLVNNTDIVYKIIDNVTFGGLVVGSGVLGYVVYRAYEEHIQLRRISFGLKTARNRELRNMFIEQVAKIYKEEPLYASRNKVFVGVYNEWKSEGIWEQMVESEEERH